MAEQKKDDSTVGSAAYYASKEYAALFKDGDVFKPLVGVNNNEGKYDDSVVENFKPPEDKNNKYFGTICEAIDLFKKWRKMKEWVKIKPKETEDIKKYEFEGYTLKIENEDILGGRARMILPYNVCVIAGLQNTDEFIKKTDDSYDKVTSLEEISDNASITHVLTKPPGFMISARDFLVVDFFYYLGNGELIMGSKSIVEHPKDPKPKKAVRGEITIDFYHIRPYYEKDINQSVVEFFTHSKMNGSIPSMITSSISAEAPLDLIGMKTFIDKNKKDIGKPGKLYIPIPLLPLLGIEAKK